MQVLWLLWLLTSAALTVGSLMPSDVVKPAARPTHSDERYPAGISIPSRVMNPTGGTYPSRLSAPSRFSSLSSLPLPSRLLASPRDEEVYEAVPSNGVDAAEERQGSSVEEPADSVESSAEVDDDDELPEDQEVDAQSIFAALVDDDEEDDGQSQREARFVAPSSRETSSSDTQAPGPPASRASDDVAVSDSRIIAKYNHFIDVFFRRINSELRDNGEPMQVSLSKKGNKKRKGGKGRKKKKGKGKKGNKSKKDKRNPRVFTHEELNGSDDQVLEEEAQKAVEVNEGNQRFMYVVNDAADEDVEELEDDATEVSDGSSRQSKDLELEDEEETDYDLAADRSGRGLSMERRRAESKKMKQNRGNKAKNSKQGKNRNQKGKNSRRRKRKGSKRRRGNNRRKKKKGNRGRSRDSLEERDPFMSQRSQYADSGIDSRKRKDENQNKKGNGDNPERSKKGKKGQKGKTNQKNKKNKRGKGSNSNTQASVSGISSMTREGNVNVTQSENTQTISSRFSLGPVSVHLSRQFSDGQMKTALSTAVLQGTVVIEVNKSGRAKVVKLKISKPFTVRTEGSLRADGSNKKKGNKSDKVIKTSIKRVSPQISKLIEDTARAVLETTSRAVRS
ncbi:hypothetical protein FHG87_008124 [Trinorchestia longiramus]|nr:hypothetical protein FHG87_008124 [Trinorchestia longiramus]